MELKSVLVVDPVDGEYTANVKISGTKIESVDRAHGNPRAIMMPGFVDTHSHGAAGVNSMKMDHAGLEKWEEFLYPHGVTFLLPSTVSALKKDMLRVADLVSSYMEEKARTSIRGVHYEGPYINVKKKGAQNPETIRPATLKELREVLTDDVILVTMAPEIDGFFEALAEMKMQDVVVSIGHTDATFAQVNKAFEAGCDRMTHFPNGMNTLHHREVGCVGAGLMLPFKLEMIVDGFHTSPEFVKLVYVIRGADNIILVTDSIDATGLEDGIYDLGGLKVTVNEGKATLDDGTIAGSTLVFDQAVRNFRKWTGCSLVELARVSSYNALTNLGIRNRGRIKEGYIADLVVMNSELNVVETILAGKTVYKL